MEFTHAVYEQYRRMVCAIAWRYTNDPQLHEDLAQQGMIGLHKACRSFRPTMAGFSTYVYTKVHGEIRQYLHYKCATVHIPISRKQRCLTQEIDFEHADERDVRLTIDLKSAINSLSEEDRELITMVFIQGMTRIEVARKLQINYETMKVRIRAAVNQLRKYLA